MPAPNDTVPSSEDLSGKVLSAEQIRVRGIVQGVGFRPFVWQLARRHGLHGRVCNDAEGVLIVVWGSPEALASFHHHLRTEAPPLARVEAIDVTPITNQAVPHDFRIESSRQGEVLTDISPDAAICPPCLAEIRDPANRRYRYPFTNCTHCGPRLSIIKAIPYDRGHTSMAGFVMCPQCQAEYDNPEDRRFHAQPNACGECGPRLWLENAQGEQISDPVAMDEIELAARLIQQGHIVAIKGIGGFHLACDATHDEAVSRLRQRKQRYHKPFALMARNVDVIRRYARVGEQESALLHDVAAPIVILRSLEHTPLARDVAPGQTQLGFILPYTPLHAMLLQAINVPVVMTSGNLSDEAQCISNDQARERLSGIADFFLFHDRDIVNRLDDSVARIIDSRPQLLRRARGYAPHPLKLPAGFENSPPILAMGAELKNTFCLIKDGKAILSQHQGDLEDASVFHDYRHNIERYQQLYDHRPEMIAVDRHPNYVSTGLGQQMAAARDIPLIEVQHHHAHIAACMAEHGLALDTKPVLGIALDGLGLGDDGHLWGGEFLLADYRGYQRLARFQPTPMLGGTRAVIEPWRNTFAHLHQSLGWEKVVQHYPNLPFVTFMQGKPISNLCTMMEKGLNSPSASSAGRLFDAVAALLELCRETVSYEGQAAMQLETLAEGTIDVSEPYPYELSEAEGEEPISIQWPNFWQALLRDVAANVPREIIAGRFHQTLVCLIVDWVNRWSKQSAFNHVVLSGGVMQNRLLLEHLITALIEQGHSVLVPRQFPVNDGGISLGQGVIVAAQAMRLGACRI